MEKINIEYSINAIIYSTFLNFFLMVSKNMYL